MACKTCNGAGGIEGEFGFTPCNCAGAVPAQYNRHQHAAHYQGMPGKGHDLERWTFATPRDGGVYAGHPSLRIAARAAGVPDSAEFHSGYVHGASQFWMFTRIAPLTGTCARCSTVSP